MKISTGLLLLATGLISLGTAAEMLSRQQAASSPLAFEVASIKTLSAYSNRTSLGCQAPNSDRTGGMRCRYLNVSVIQLIYSAYGGRGLPPDSQLAELISGAPGWANTEKYDIEAETESAPTPSQLSSMLQSLLADRFKLKIHREEKPRSGLVLVIAKGGLKFKEADDGEQPRIMSGFHLSPEGERLAHIEGIKTTMEGLAQTLSKILDPVEDATGLTGKYDFFVSYIRDSGTAVPASSEAPAGPSLPTALKEQLGLQLETRKTMTELIVIDHVEKPTPN